MTRAEARRDATGSAGPALDERILAVVRSIAAGDVLTYGEVAAEAGRPGAARAVGRVLATTVEDVPWWRVVNARGRLVPGHEVEHERRLRIEGVELRDGRVVLG